MAKKRTSKQRPSTKAASEIAALFEFQRVRLVHCEADLIPTQELAALRTEIGIQSTGHSQTGEDSRINVDLEFSLKAVDEKQDPNEQPSIAIAVKYQLTYGSNSVCSLDADHLRVFIQSTAISDAWPYWRELVQAMTMRMGLPPMSLPLSAKNPLSMENQGCVEPSKSHQAKKSTRKKRAAKKVATKKKR